MASASPTGRYFGKYRATVLNNLDPHGRGRLLLNVADVAELAPGTWAEACTSLAGPPGPGMGAYFMPAVGAGVWAEFEQGDPRHPIWSGCRWSAESDLPTAANHGPQPFPGIVLQSLLQHALVISDLPPTPVSGGIVLQSATGAMIVVNDSGVYITNGKGASLTLVGPSVDLNAGALVVT